MNPLKKLSILAAAAIPAVALFAGTANAAIADHVTNGGFNINAKGWTPNENATIAKHDGFPMGVLTNVRTGASASAATATQCMPVMPNLDVEFQGRAFIPENQQRKGSATFQVSLFADENCSDFLVGAELPAQKVTGEWKEFYYNPVPWPGGVAHSARVTMVVEKNLSGFMKRNEPFMAFFDDIKLTQVYVPVPEGEPAEDDCLCAPAAEEEPAEPAAPTDDGPIPAEPVGGEDDDDGPIPAEPVGGHDEPAQPEPAVGGDDADEPVQPGPAVPADEPDAPAQPAAQDQDSSDVDGDSSGELAPTAPDADGDEPEADDAETSEQYELTNDDNQRPALGSGQTETPAAPATGENLGGPASLVGADELGLLGGAIAFFGLVLAAIAMKRERSNN